ncbi:hypothetical protein [Hyphomonas sp. GM-8P]|jgi:hypothetical protein|uniref:hypothetical protein n=1 Tax=Hyphomonas sp. GM-8P TaxID=1280945 RepID=UPI000DBF66F2|nr:hypothetical protein [Hyphomonas sp. GM-8P]RAN42029.1 hypothetical protein HY26_00280 [Hyphomonas sp. GM-8P]
MEWRDPDAPVDLSPVGSETIRRVIERAIEEGNRVASISQWTKALVAHMELGLSEGLKADIRAQYPALEYYEDAGSPHNEPDEGFIEDGFAVSFPRPRPQTRPG